MDEQQASISESATQTTRHGAATPDAIGLLTADHRKASLLFSEYELLIDGGDPDEKFEIAKKVCGELLIHMAIEEAIFYPASRQSIEDNDLIEDAESEHDEAKELIRMLGEIKPDDPSFDLAMTALADAIEQHVQEEESQMFPKVLISDMDIVALGRELQEAKSTMRSNLGLPPT